MLDVTDVDELQVNNSSHTKGTSYLSSKRVNGHQKMVFERGRTNKRHKTRNDRYLGLMTPNSSIVWLLIRRC